MVELKFYNTFSKKKEIFEPLRKDFVGIYSCGPTVYDYAHIGNLRSFVFADVLKRILSYNGYKVKHVMNITDVDDKIIKKSQKLGISRQELTRKYEQAFLENLKSLNVIMPDVMPRATEHIKEMVELIKKLMEKGYAYKSDDGIYYDVSKFKDYGKLAGLKLDKKKMRSRIRADEYGKEDIQDFALWKFYDAEDGGVFWETELGKGRPGWHIECSAMSMKYLGETFDIHTGGIDLVFPHHTNEIAQSEAATGKKFVRYWLHCEHLVMPEGKMSKSLGNIITLHDILEKGYNPIALRYLYLSAHYRSQLKFSYEKLKAASNTLERLYNIAAELKNDRAKIRSRIVEKWKKQFLEAINDDMDLPRALAVMWKMLRDENLSKGEKFSLLLDFDKVLGLDVESVAKEEIPAEIIKLVQEREEARARKDWETADRLREEIKAKGYWVDDTPEGPRVKKIKN